METVRFEGRDWGGVVAAMRELDGGGAGWINIGPALSDDDVTRVPERSGLAAWFSGRGPAVAMATWSAGAATGRTRPAQIGIEHGTGPNALRRLDEQGLGLPAQWAKRQDHAKHGIVADLPAGVDPEAVLGWLLGAVRALTEAVTVGDEWAAVIHRPG